MSQKATALRGLVGLSLSLASLALVWGCQSIAGIEERTLGPCGEFCDTVMANCTGHDQVYDTKAKCMAICELLPPGDDVEPDRTNTVECRLRAARAAGTALDEDVNELCRTAGPEALNCKGPCESYCTLYAGACGEQQCGSHAGCLHACSALLDTGSWDLHEDHDGDTLQCRLLHLSNASVQPAQHCHHSQIIAPTAFCNWTIDEGDKDPSRPMEPDCADYCRVSGVACTGDNRIYESEAQCLAVCGHMQSVMLGDFTDTAQNTLGCRIYHSHNSLCAPAQHCSHAGPGGDGHCGSMVTGNCEAYCGLAASICGTDFDASFADQDECLAACADFDGAPGDSKYFVRTGAAGGDTLDCRFLALSRAALDDSECPGAFGAAPCAD